MSILGMSQIGIENTMGKDRKSLIVFLEIEREKIKETLNIFD